MIITFERQALLTALTRIGGIATKGHSIAVCRHTLIEATTGQVTFRATNLDMEITVTVAAEVTKPGACLALADTLLSIAKNASAGADITFDLGERLAVKSGRSRFNLALLPIEEFPLFPALDKPVSFDLPANELRELISSTAFSVGHDPAKFAFTGVYLFSDGGKLGSVATDGKRLTLFEQPTDIADFGVIVPPPMVAEMTKLLEGAETATLAVSKAKIALVYGLTLITSKLLEAKYPDFRRVIPAEWPNALTVDRAMLIATLRRAEVGTGNDFFALTMKVSDGLIAASARGQDADAADECECDYAGDEMIVALNGKHTLDALNACDGETVEIAFAGGVGGHLMMRSPGDGAFRAIMMPLRG